MVSYNKVFMTGEVYSAPEVIPIENGFDGAKIILKTEHNEKEVCYIEALIWGHLAEVAIARLRPGHIISIEARLICCNVEDPSGGQLFIRHCLEVIHIMFLINESFLPVDTVCDFRPIEIINI